MIRSFCLFFAALFVVTSLVGRAQSDQKLSATEVPFVGCESDGQIGPLSAPRGKGMALPIATTEGRQLAYYKADRGLGVLGPRGWFCFGGYGSGGYVLYVAPEKITADEAFSNTWSGFAGPAIELIGEYGGTSGRFFVAGTIARVFPAHRQFVEAVLADPRNL